MSNLGLILNILRKYRGEPILVRPFVKIKITSKPTIIISLDYSLSESESDFILLEAWGGRREGYLRDLIDVPNNTVYINFGEGDKKAYGYALSSEGVKYLEENFKIIPLNEKLKKDFITEIPIENFGARSFNIALNLLYYLKDRIDVKIVVEKETFDIQLEHKNNVWIIKGDTYDLRGIIKRYGGSWSYSLKAWVFHSEKSANKAYNALITTIEGYREQLQELKKQAIELKKQLMKWAGIEPKPEELKEELDKLIASMAKPKEEEKKEETKKEEKKEIEITEELKEKLLPEWLCKVYVVAKRRVLQSEYKGAKGEYEVNGSELKETKVVLKDKAIAFRNFRSRFTRFLRLTSIQTPMGWIIAKPTEEVLNIFNQYMSEYAELVRKYSPESPVKPIRLVEAYIPKKVVIEMAREYVIDLKASLEDVEKRLKEIEELMQKVKDEDELSKLNKENKNLLRRKKELKKLIDQAMDFIEEIEKPKKIPELISKRVEALKKVL